MVAGIMTWRFSFGGRVFSGSDVWWGDVGGGSCRGDPYFDVFAWYGFGFEIMSWASFKEFLNFGLDANYL